MSSNQVPGMLVYDKRRRRIEFYTFGDGQKLVDVSQVPDQPPLVEPQTRLVLYGVFTGTSNWSAERSVKNLEPAPIPMAISEMITTLVSRLTPGELLRFQELLDSSPDDVYEAVSEVAIRLNPRLFSARVTTFKPSLDGDPRVCVNCGSSEDEHVTDGGQASPFCPVPEDERCPSCNCRTSDHSDGLCPIQELSPA